MRVTRRKDVPIVFLTFDFVVTDVGDPVSIEVSRLCMSETHAKRMVDVLARSLDYYPTKPEPKATES